MVRMRSPVQIRLAAPHSRKASLATPRRNLWGVCFLPHAKNQRFFPRGPRLCLRLCPTKYPRFAAVLCGDPVVFPQKKNARRAPRSSFLCVAPELSRCSLIFAPRDGGCRRHLRVSNFGHVRKVRSLFLALKCTQSAPLIAFGWYLRIFYHALF